MAIYVIDGNVNLTVLGDWPGLLWLLTSTNFPYFFLYELTQEPIASAVYPH